MSPKDSSGDVPDLPSAHNPKMKIALQIKPFTVKASLFLAFLAYITVQSTPVSAGFLSNIINTVVGSEILTLPPKEQVVHNSQNVPLLEPVINPDLKNIKDDAPMATALDATLLSKNESLAIDYDLDNDFSSATITTYKVKKGDTIEGISKKLNVPQSTILASNADLKKKDLLKIGQNLVILGLNEKLAKADTTKIETVVKKDNAKDDKKESKETKENKESKAKSPTKEVDAEKIDQKNKEVKTVVKVVSPVVPTPVAVEPIVIAEPIVTKVTLPILESQPEVSTQADGQPKGTIVGGYIWPFAAGVGRVSQGLHADMAYDFSAPTGTPIYAIQSGVVLIARPSGYNGGYGKYVVINFDDGRQAIFGHMSKVASEEGQVVKQGDIIGYVGSTGKSTGPHVHIGFHGDLGNPYLGLKVNSRDIDHD